ncbi:hypothetical protein ABIB50_003902 [Mucilaginibacter sp. UYCu711]
MLIVIILILLIIIVLTHSIIIIIARSIIISVEGIFKQVLALLRIRKAVDFEYYKSDIVKRQIVLRMALTKFEKTS